MNLKQASFLAFVAAVICLCQPVMAQAPTSVHGSVHLRSGTDLPNATVNLSDAQHGITRSGMADKDGNFSVNEVPAGSYRIQVSVHGLVVYDEPLPPAALAGKSVDISVTSEKALADIALLHPEETVDVTATRQAEDLLTSASSVSVVSRSELEARNVQTVDEGLDQVPGLYVQRIQGLADTEASTYLRGFVLRRCPLECGPGRRGGEHRGGPRTVLLALRR